MSHSLQISTLSPKKTHLIAYFKQKKLQKSRIGSWRKKHRTRPATHKKQKSEKGCRSPKRGYRKDAAIELLNIIELLQKAQNNTTKKRATKQIQNNLKFTHQKLGFKLKATNFAFSINR